MDERVAAELAAELKGVGRRLNALSAISVRIADEAERKAFRDALGRLIILTDTDLIRPIAQQYPHLDAVEGQG